MAAGLEREIKLHFDDANAARGAILNAGAVLIGARRRQHDCLLDFPDRRLSATGAALRVRLEPTRAWLTYKGPVLDTESSPMKVREEVESEVANGAVVMKLLQSLGLDVWFRYEKDREEYTCEGAVIALDDTPIGTYVEIEGDEAAIVRVAALLGRTSDDYVRDSYRALFRSYCHRHACAASNMLFDEMGER